MLIPDIRQALRFYFITDDASISLSPVDQVKIAVSAGAGTVQYRNKKFTPHFYDEVVEIKNVCKSNDVLFIVNDDMVLAKAIGADGVHVGQEDEHPAIARHMLGPDAVVGVSVSTPDELKKTDLTTSDYIGVGPVYPTGTKADAKSIIGLSGLNHIAAAVDLPVVAIGGINADNAAACFESGASGISVISAISRSETPEKSARALARVCGCVSHDHLDMPWKDEFGLIDRLIAAPVIPLIDSTWIIFPPGDDAALLKAVSRPVVTTDAHREGVHFSFRWQTPEDVGQKAVSVTFSDLAAAYARPVGFFINLGLPAHVSDKTVESLYQGIRWALRIYGCELGGGNVSSSDMLSLDLFALGQGLENIFPVRSAAKPGDGLYCTGPLGMAAAGLKALMKKEQGYERLIEKFKFPKARFDAAQVLADHGVACVMDISDGLAGDAAHIAKASGVSIRLSIDPDRIDAELKEFCSRSGLSAMDTALAGGEDYELLFACAPEIFEQIQKYLPQTYAVGECLPFSGTHILNPPQRAASFQHGKK